MKINNWSVVKSPNGVSLKSLKGGEVINSYEVCVSIQDGVLTVNLHKDGFDPVIMGSSIVLTQDACHNKEV